LLHIVISLFNQVGKGTYWRALPLGQELVNRGHAVTLLVTSRDRRVGFKTRTDDGVTVVETPDLLPGSLRSGWDLWNVLSRIGWLRGRAVDLVHAFEGRPVAFLPALYLQRAGKGIPLVLDWCDWFGRGGSVEERPNPLLRAVLRPVETFFEETSRPRADGTTVISTVLRQKAIDLGVPSERILLLPNGFRVETLPCEEQAAIRRRLGLPEDLILLAYVGALFRRDAKLMAGAFDRIQAVRPDVRLLLIGCNVAVEALVQSPHAVIAIPWVSRTAVADYLAASDICWMPLCNTGANQGRFPLKLGEFLMAGRPVVATDVGDMGTLLAREAAGRVAPDDPQLLAEAVLSLLSQPSEMDRLARRARQVAQERFDVVRVANELETFYYQVIEWTTR